MNAQNARTTKRPAPKGKRRLLTRKRILLTLLGLFLAGVATVAVAWVAIGIPTPNQLAEAQASIVYYSDGKTEMDRITQMDGNRESVPLSKVPVHVQHALLAAEDRSFYQNKGVSPTGIGRALVAAIKGGPTQGGSTITQQYVKNYFLTQDQTLSRSASCHRAGSPTRRGRCRSARCRSSGRSCGPRRRGGPPGPPWGPWPAAPTGG